MITTTVLPTAYLPSIYYFKLLMEPSTTIDSHEHFVKQTLRNRCCIYGANGTLELSIPLLKSPNNTATQDKQMSSDTDWKTMHWRSITSAYNSSAYFEYFEDEFKPLFSKTNAIQSLVEWNTALIQVIFKTLRIKKALQFSNTYVESTELIIDGRKNIETELSNYTFKPYYQVFSDKHGFIPNLSILDLLFHKGLESLEYL